MYYVETISRGRGRGKKITRGVRQVIALALTLASVTSKPNKNTGKRGVNVPESAIICYAWKQRF